MGTVIQGERLALRDGRPGGEITSEVDLGSGEAVILQANGMLVTGQAVADACVKAIFLEEMAHVQLLARAAGLEPKAYTAETAARRNGDDKVHEPIRGWEYYTAAAERKLPLSS